MAAAAQQDQTQPTAAGPLGVAVSGASGLIGGALCELLGSKGHDVYRLVRRRPRDASEIEWDPANGLLDPKQAPPLDAVVHLAAESIASGRWTREKKRRIHDSRVLGTSELVASLARMDSPPRAFLCASAVGFYGGAREEPATEEADPGEGFLAEVCRDWEASAHHARELGVRVVCLRFGVVLARDGGALAKMKLPFRLGLGGRLGSGRQWMPWIALVDAVAAIRHVLERKMEGAVNVTAPHPVTNAELTRTLARVLERPAIFPAPAPLLRLVLGEAADELLLASTHAVPKALLDSGFEFRYPELEPALRTLLR